jgi:hypothetical protein
MIELFSTFVYEKSATETLLNLINEQLFITL